MSLLTTSTNTLVFASGSSTVGAVGAPYATIDTAGASGSGTFTLNKGIVLPASLASGQVNLGANVLTNVGDPVATSDAATKNYVLTVALNKVDSNYNMRVGSTPSFGGSNTGNIVFGSGAGGTAISANDSVVIGTNASGNGTNASAERVAIGANAVPPAPL